MSDKQAKKMAQGEHRASPKILAWSIDSRIAQGLGADNAPGHTEGHAPGEAPVASDSFNSNVGVDAGSNQPGEKGDVGVTVGEKPNPGINQGNSK